MDMRWRAGLALVVLGGAVASPGWGQRPQRRDGFWIGFGVGYGWAHVACDGCLGVARTGGATGFLKLGGTLSPHVLLGGQVNVWAHDDGASTEGIANVTASLYYYPDARRGLFLTGGLGFSDYSTDSRPAFEGSGWGATLGVGYDVRVGRNVSLTPIVHWVYGAVGDVNQGALGPGFTGWRQNVIDVGLGVTFH